MERKEIDRGSRVELLLKTMKMPWVEDLECLLVTDSLDTNLELLLTSNERRLMKESGVKNM